MQKNSYLCNFIADHPTDWKEQLEGYPYFLRISIKSSLAIFNYDLTKSVSGIDKNTGESVRYTCDFNLPIVQEARGIIIDTDTLDVVCWPFRKFGNYGEYYCDEMDWRTARVQEKVDGSIVKLWNYKGVWHISSNKQIYATDPLPSGKCIRELFLEAAEKQNLTYNVLKPDYTSIFELVGPTNKVVLSYPETAIYHIGTRHKSGTEFREDIGIQKPREYPIGTLDGCLKAAKELNSGCEASDLAHEGFVVVDANWNRIKIKSPEYVLAHGLITGTLSTRKVVEMIREGEEEEFLAYCPDQKPFIEETRRKLTAVESSIQSACIHYMNLWEQCSHNRKIFALLIKDDDMKWIGFETAVKGRAVEEIVEGMSTTSIMQIIGKTPEVLEMQYSR